MDDRTGPEDCIVQLQDDALVQQADRTGHCSRLHQCAAPEERRLHPSRMDHGEQQEQSIECVEPARSGAEARTLLKLVHGRRHCTKRATVRTGHFVSKWFWIGEKNWLPRRLAV